MQRDRATGSRARAKASCSPLRTNVEGHRHVADHVRARRTRTSPPPPALAAQPTAELVPACATPAAERFTVHARRPTLSPDGQANERSDSRGVRRTAALNGGQPLEPRERSARRDGDRGRGSGANTGPATATCSARPASPRAWGQLDLRFEEASRMLDERLADVVRREAALDEDERAVPSEGTLAEGRGGAAEPRSDESGARRSNRLVRTSAPGASSTSAQRGARPAGELRGGQIANDRDRAGAAEARRADRRARAARGDAGRAGTAGAAQPGRDGRPALAARAGPRRRRGGPAEARRGGWSAREARPSGARPEQQEPQAAQPDPAERAELGAASTPPTGAPRHSAEREAAVAQREHDAQQALAQAAEDERGQAESGASRPGGRSRRCWPGSASGSAPSPSARLTSITPSPRRARRRPRGPRPVAGGRREDRCPCRKPRR